MNIYEEYGKACIQLEIWQGRVMELKKKIAEEMSAPKKVEEVLNVERTIP